MPTFNVQTSVAYLNPATSTVANDGISDEPVELDAVPAEATVLADLADLRAGRDGDPAGSSYRRVYIGQGEPNANDERFFTEILLDVTLPPDA